jgi:hypothetical protein
MPNSIGSLVIAIEAEGFVVESKQLPYSLFYIQQKIREHKLPFF